MMQLRMYEILRLFGKFNLYLVGAILTTWSI